MSSRWWIYQKERFPVLAHGPMVVVFCLSIMLYSSLQESALPQVGRFVGAVITTIILFFQLRVADEFKDFADDSRFRAHRAVPRGLVTLRELGWIAGVGAAVQFGIALRIDVGLVPVLMLVWLYMGLMTREFFVPAWLRKTPSVYLVSHMLVMPLIGFYVSAFDWLCAGRIMPRGLGWVLLFSFCCGLVLELGRKIRAPGAERTGVETYSALWGPRVALATWAVAGVMSVAAYLQASMILGLATRTATVAIGVAALLLMGGVLLANWSAPRGNRFLESFSGLFAMLLYLGLGPMQALLA